MAPAKHKRGGVCIQERKERKGSSHFSKPLEECRWRQSQRVQDGHQIVHCLHYLTRRTSYLHLPIATCALHLPIRPDAVESLPASSSSSKRRNLFPLVVHDGCRGHRIVAAASLVSGAAIVSVKLHGLLGPLLGLPLSDGLLGLLDGLLGFLDLWWWSSAVRGVVHEAVNRTNRFPFPWHGDGTGGI